MTHRQQWTLIAGIVMTAVFGVALAIKLRPQLSLLEVGSRAPDFSAIDLRANRPVTFADYRGKVIMLNVWATWCGPCIREMPSMERLHQRFKGTDFVMLGISVDEEGSDKVLKFANDLGVTFDILHDQSGAIQGIYQTVGVPESFVIDRDGVIVKKVIGDSEWDNPVNVTLVQRLLDAR
jgi:cytochrome c biogenesis protein CcmG/thiol:disulfide interchange protein DsbE